MTQEPPLTEFTLSNTDESDAGTDASGQSPADAVGHPLSSIATYAWGEYVCERCSESAVRVWQVDGAAVCPACKEW